MSVDDLELLRGSIPELFDDKRVPLTWEEDWVFVSEQDALDVLSDMHAQDSERFEGIDGTGSSGVPIFEDSPFPGAPIPRDASMALPPPDCLAFYLPFHHYHPVWWGVYLVVEPLAELALYVLSRAGGVLDLRESVRVAQAFAYNHEAFHHNVECFAMRLEIAHRAPLYRTAFVEFYRDRAGTNRAIEEALASAYAWMKVDRMFRSPLERSKRLAAGAALADYILACPPGYNRAMEFVSPNRFEQARDEFAEDNLNHALPALACVASDVWRCFPHAFSGVSRVDSRVNYAVHRDSPLYQRFSGRGYYLSKRELSRKLRKLAGCAPVGEGSSHELWEGPKGRFTVPRHTGDLKTGTLSKIVKQAGLDMSVSEFVSARV